MSMTEKLKWQKQKEKKAHTHYIKVYKCRLVKFEGFEEKRIGHCLCVCGFRDYIQCLITITYF